MTTDYEIVRYRPEFLEPVLELQKHLWGTDPAVNRAYLEWKYEQNPYRTPPLIYLVLSKGSVVAMRGMFGVNWEAGDPSRTYPGVCPEDLVIAPEHRNRGLLNRIMRHSFRDLQEMGYPYLYSLSAGPITLMSSLSMGWRNAGSMRPYRRVTRQAEAFHRVRRYLGRKRFLWRYADRLTLRNCFAREQPLLDLVKRKGAVPWNIGSRISLERVAKPGEMARLVRRVGHDGRIRHVRDETYLTWRFRNPLHRYLFLYWEEPELEGYMVLQEYLSELRNRVRVNIVDWEATSERVRIGLLEAAIQLRPISELSIWTATLGEETKDLLRGSGFLPVPEREGVEHVQICLLVRAAGDDRLRDEWSIGGLRLQDLGNWDLRMIYSMDG
jgi:hypothetical protein